MKALTQHPTAAGAPVLEGIESETSETGGGLSRGAGVIAIVITGFIALFISAYVSWTLTCVGGAAVDVAGRII